MPQERVSERVVEQIIFTCDCIPIAQWSRLSVGPIVKSNR